MKNRYIILLLICCICVLANVARPNGTCNGFFFVNSQGSGNGLPLKYNLLALEPTHYWDGTTNTVGWIDRINGMTGTGLPTKATSFDVTVAAGSNSWGEVHPVYRSDETDDRWMAGHWQPTGTFSIVFTIGNKRNFAAKRNIFFDQWNDGSKVMMTMRYYIGYTPTGLRFTQRWSDNTSQDNIYPGLVNPSSFWGWRSSATFTNWLGDAVVVSGTSGGATGHWYRIEYASNTWSFASDHTFTNLAIPVITNAKALVYGWDETQNSASYNAMFCYQSLILFDYALSSNDACDLLTYLNPTNRLINTNGFLY